MGPNKCKGVITREKSNACDREFAPLHNPFSSSCFRQNPAHFSSHDPSLLHFRCLWDAHIPYARRTRKRHKAAQGGTPPSSLEAIAAWLRRWKLPSEGTRRHTPVIRRACCFVLSVFFCGNSSHRAKFWFDLVRLGLTWFDRPWLLAVRGSLSMAGPFISVHNSPLLHFCGCSIP
jgi:hypothetical protein